jgi:hypothetical protein
MIRAPKKNLNSRQNPRQNFNSKNGVDKNTFMKLNIPLNMGITHNDIYVDLFNAMEEKKSKYKQIINPNIFTYTCLEYRLAFIDLCDKLNRCVTISDTYCDPEFDDWFLQVETINSLMDLKIESTYQIDPIYSMTGNNQVIVSCDSVTSDQIFNEVIDIPSNIKVTMDELLPHVIGISQECNPCKVHISHTVGDFCNIINNLVKPSDNSNQVNKINGNAFSSPLTNEIDIRSLVHEIKTTLSDDHRDKKMKEYAELFSGWSFAKLSEKYKNGDSIPDQKIKDKNNRTVNDININAKILSSRNSPKVISDNFDTGLIENLVCSFVFGRFIDEVTCLHISRAIIREGRNYIEGYRIRIILNTLDPNIIIPTKKWISENYIRTISEDDNCNYKDCIVNISANIEVKPKKSPIGNDSKTKNSRNPVINRTNLYPSVKYGAFKSNS